MYEFFLYSIFRKPEDRRITKKEKDATAAKEAATKLNEA